MDEKEPIALLPPHIIKCLECDAQGIEKTFDNYIDQ